MTKTVTLIFDIGKTNKKLFLFDEDLVNVYQEYQQFDEVADDDGYPCEDLNTLSEWILDCTDRVLNNAEYVVKAINFSAYGASMVHLNDRGKPIAPFYNYLKPFPEDLKEQFFKKYNNEGNFSLITASPWLGFLNSGLQLYYLKYRKPQIYENLHMSIHFPQYLSFLLTGKLVSDYTSVGCHTGLWDYRNNRYASWVTEEGFEKYMAPLHPSTEVYETHLEGKTLSVGVGVHDSSSALIPFLEQADNAFVLLSTGTWSICVNYFNKKDLTRSELQNDCLNFLSIQGHSIKASRLFLGQEHQEQAKNLESYFGKKSGSHKNVSFDASFIPISGPGKKCMFKYHHLNVSRFGFEESEETQYDKFLDLESAYHQLVHELSELQIASLQLVLDAPPIKDIYIDGGFADNAVFIQMLANKLPEYRVHTSRYALGSALGAAMLVNQGKNSSHVLEKSYQLKVHKHMTITK